MQDLVDQSHRIDLSRTDCLLREMDEVLFLIDLLGKYPGGAKIGEDHIPSEGEEGFVELIKIADLPRDVEFHHYGVLRMAFLFREDEFLCHVWGPDPFSHPNIGHIPDGNKKNVGNLVTLQKQ